MINHMSREKYNHQPKKECVNQVDFEINYNYRQINYSINEKEETRTIG